jgi:hypothetical protein
MASSNPHLKSSSSLPLHHYYSHSHIQLEKGMLDMFLLELMERFLAPLQPH